MKNYAWVLLFLSATALGAVTVIQDQANPNRTLKVNADGSINTTGGSAGVQYTEGDVDATPTGTVAMGKDPFDVLKALGLSTLGNLNVNLAEGTITGGNAAAGPTGDPVPASASYTGYNSGGNLVGVSTSNPLPVAQQGSVAVTGTFFQATQPVSGSLGRTWTLSSGTDSIASVQSGAWTMGRTWTLSSGTDSIASVQSGTWNLNNISGTISLPTGAATAARQDTGNTSLASIDDKETTYSPVTFGPTAGATDLILFEIDTKGWAGATLSAIVATTSGAGANEADLVIDFRNSTSDAWTQDSLGIKSQDGTTPSGGTLYLTAGNVTVANGTVILIPKGRYIRGRFSVWDDSTGTSDYTANVVLKKVTPLILPQAAEVTVVNTNDAPVYMNPAFSPDSEVFVDTTPGPTQDVSFYPKKVFSLQVNKTGAVTSWDVVLEGSLNGSTWTTILEHTNTTPGDGKMMSTGALLTPVLYFRTRPVSLVLGGGTNIITSSMGMN